MGNSEIKTLKFVNNSEDYDEPRVDEIKLAQDQDVAEIIQWYGSHYSGDPYEVYLNGKRLNVDHNGYLQPTIIEGLPVEEQILINMQEK